MGNPANVVKAIESFDSWNTPWEFAKSVSVALASDPSDCLLFEQVWAKACDREIWLPTDSLGSGAVAAESALSASFPWLSPMASQQLAKGASYQWR